MDPEIQKSLQWVRTYEQTRNAGLTCLHCGISRPTLRLWWQRDRSDGIEGLRARSRVHNPHQTKRYSINGFCLFVQNVKWAPAELRKNFIDIMLLISAWQPSKKFSFVTK